MINRGDSKRNHKKSILITALFVQISFWECGQSLNRKLSETTEHPHQVHLSGTDSDNQPFALDTMYGGKFQNGYHNILFIVYAILENNLHGFKVESEGVLILISACPNKMKLITRGLSQKIDSMWPTK
ncbi:hypothetical protein BCY86_05360 [Pajaroellobacter abortibovis]|uniref:Uncharacterized protein n=1 Tax=Pajaroellobacter abortibovis TaxID=1882918 RepID=A0A1L6MX75_9BACT|nr:hypothetical protein BCY86_05360 [Pajaroellobacter abortibovis]